MLVESELEGSADAIVALYNKCLRCHRKIKAPQVYGPKCAKKVLEASPEKADTARAAVAGPDRDIDFIGKGLQVVG